MKEVELAPIKESTEDYERIELAIKAAFKRILYFPLLKELGVRRGLIKNSKDDLANAIAKGKLEYKDGIFSGDHSASTTKELRKLGAKWDRKTQSFLLPFEKLPYDIQTAIEAGERNFRDKLSRIDALLAKKMPEEIAGQIKTAHFFDSTLLKVDRKLQASVKDAITLPPALTATSRKRLSDEWQNNLDLWIKDFSEKEIVRLRKDVQRSVFGGNRNKELAKALQRSYDITANKAKFLARQETSLMMTKFKESRYNEAGSTKYRWRCVAGSKNHPVRPSHKILDGKIFSWNDPPITTPPGESTRRNNPGQDYNCRCFARPIINFRNKSETEKQPT